MHWHLTGGLKHFFAMMIDWARC